MKKVLIPLASYADDKLEAIRKNVIRNTYLNKLFHYELLPILVAPESPQHIIDHFYSECSGVLLMGGFDINPASYGAELDPRTTATSQNVDQFEIGLIKRTIADKKPLFAICRGAQMLNVALGGTMHQEIEDLKLNEQHQFTNMNYDSLILDGPRHKVLIDPASKAFQIMQTETVEVNSGHHQVIDMPGDGIVISGKSPAGVPEIIEYSKSDHFLFGFQSHPETEEESFFEPFFAAFAAAL